MTIPRDYLSASADFERVLDDVKATSMLATHNQAFAETRAVLHVFRSHLTPGQAARFAGVLPAGLRALFVADWDADRPPAPFPDVAGLEAEIADTREAHNTAPASARADVAAVLARHVDAAALERVLATLPAMARAFWTP